MDRGGTALTTSRRNPNQLPIWLIGLLALAPAVFIAGLYLWPVITLTGRGLSASEPFAVLARPRIRQVIWFSAWQAAISTIATLAIGLGPAYVIARYQFLGRRLLLSALTATFVMPTVVMGAAITAIGIGRGVTAILIAHVVFNLAVVVRVAGPFWQQIPRDLSLAASTLGASPMRVFWHVSLPLLRPALWASAAIIFLLTFTSFGVVRVLGTPERSTIEVEIWRRATQLGDLPGAIVLSVIQLMIMLILIGGSVVLQRRSGLSLQLDTSTTPESPHGMRDSALVAVVAGLTALTVAVPFLAMITRSLRNRDGFTLAGWRNLGVQEIRPGITLGVDPMASIGASVQTAIWATLIAVIVGGLASLVITAARGRAAVLDLAVMLPLGTSAVTIGLGMVLTFSRWPVDWRNRWWLLVLGHAVVAVPFVVRTTVPVLRAIPQGLSDAASTLGAAPIRAWWLVVVSQLWRPLGASAGVVAAISLGEFGASSMLSRSGTETMPIVIEGLLGRTGTLLQAQAFALATILATITMLVVAVVDRLTSRAPDKLPMLRVSRRSR
jgi:thiamine transport system permease protein